MDRKILVILAGLLFVLPCVGGASIWSKANDARKSTLEAARSTARAGQHQVNRTVEHPVQTAQQGAQAAQDVATQGAQTVHSAVHSVSSSTQSTTQPQAGSGKFKSVTVVSGKVKTTP